MSFDGKVVKGAPTRRRPSQRRRRCSPTATASSARTRRDVYRDGEGRTRRDQNAQSPGPFASAGEPAADLRHNARGRRHYLLPAHAPRARKMGIRQRFEYKIPEGPSRAARPRTCPAAAGCDGAPPRVFVGLRLHRPRPGSDAAAAGDGRAPPGDVFVYSKSSENVKDEKAAANSSKACRPKLALDRDHPGGRDRATSAPIEIVSERWSLARTPDGRDDAPQRPRFAETVYRLTKISRAEPSRTALRVPADYNPQGRPQFLRSRGRSRGGRTTDRERCDDKRDGASASPRPLSVGRGASNIQHRDTEDTAGAQRVEILHLCAPSVSSCVSVLSPTTREHLVGARRAPSNAARWRAGRRGAASGRKSRSSRGAGA